MSRMSRIMKILQIIDVIDTVELIDDFERDMISNVNFDEACHDEEYQMEDIKIPQRPLRDMTNPIEMFSNAEFKQRYSFSKSTVLYILDLIVHGLERSTNRGKPVPPLIELLITLKFMTTGTFQSMIDDLHGVSQPTISRLILKVSSLLAEQRNIFIKYPSSNDVPKISKTFYDNYKLPFIAGCLGSTHVGIKNPGGQISEAYLNEHGYYSLKVQIICGPHMEFMDFVSRWPGSTHESKIFNISDIKSQLETNKTKGFLLASSTYPQIKHLLTPINNPKSNAELKYNNLHRNTYNVPQAVELWKKRFKCLTSILANKEETTRSIIHATAVLHNIALKHNEELSTSDANEPINEPKGKEVKRTFPLDKPLNPESRAITDRDNYIKEYFTS